MGLNGLKANCVWKRQKRPEIQHFQIRMDESQEREATQLSERLQHELDILTAYQSKSKLAGEQQRSRERMELEERVSVRKTLLEQKMDEETQQFLQERSERIRLLHERQAREIEQFDDESTRLGFRYLNNDWCFQLPRKTLGSWQNSRLRRTFKGKLHQNYPSLLMTNY